MQSFKLTAVLADSVVLHSAVNSSSPEGGGSSNARTDHGSVVAAHTSLSTPTILNKKPELTLRLDKV